VPSSLATTRTLRTATSPTLDVDSVARRGAVLVLVDEKAARAGACDHSRQEHDHTCQACPRTVARTGSGGLLSFTHEAIVTSCTATVKGLHQRRPSFSFPDPAQRGSGRVSLPL